MTDTTYILGVNLFDKDSAACLLADGCIVAAVDEERFIRVKHFGGFPRRSIAYCLETAGIGLDEVHRVVGQLTRREVYERMGRSYRPAPPEPLPRRTRDRDAEHHGFHHLAHAASAYYGSGFDEACVLTADAMGDEDSAVLFVGRGTELQRQWSIPQQNLRIGGVYENVTEQLGFGEFGQGKVMGLAPYGKVRDDWRELVNIRDEKTFASNYMDTKSHPLRAIRRLPGEAILQEHKDLAATLQHAFEQSILALVRAAWKRTGLRRFCLAGGVFLNCSLNGKIAGLEFVDELFVQPNAIDPGTALGMAWYAWADYSNDFGPFTTCALGPEYSDDTIRAVLLPAAENGFIHFEAVDDPAHTAADALAAGEIIGWFQGRMEWGPRALGQRSILADPRKSETWETVNRKKGRESWRPLAPSVLAERSEEWFEGGGANPYMLVARNVVEDKRSLVPAITHVDGTARPQAVERRTHPKFHSLIQRFEEITGVPMVLDTSFNDRNEPIVMTPEQALNSFLHMGLDRLVIGGFSVTPRQDGLQRLFSPVSLALSGVDNIGFSEGVQRLPGVTQAEPFVFEHEKHVENQEDEKKSSVHVHFHDKTSDELSTLLAYFPENDAVVSVGVPLLSSREWEVCAENTAKRGGSWLWIDPVAIAPETARWVAEIRKNRLGKPQRILIARGEKAGSERDGAVNPYRIHESYEVRKRLDEDLRLLASLGVTHLDVLEVEADRGDLRRKRFRASLRQDELTVELRYGQKEDFGHPDRIEATMPQGTLRLERSDSGRRTLLWITARRRERLWPILAPTGELAARQCVLWLRRGCPQEGWNAKIFTEIARLRERLMEPVLRRMAGEIEHLKAADNELASTVRAENTPEALSVASMVFSIRNPASNVFGKVDDEAYFESIEPFPYFLPDTDPWLVLLKAGEFPAFTFNALPPDEARDIASVYRAEWLHVTESTDEHQERSLFVSRDAQNALHLEEVQKSLKIEKNRQKREELLWERGRLLGHPDCCTEASVQRDRSDLDTKWLCPSPQDSHGGYDWRCNSLLPGLPISHVPCHCACDATAQQVEKRLRILANALKIQGNTPGTSEMELSFARRFHTLPMLYWDRFRFVVFEGDVFEDRIRYRRVHSFYTFRNWPRFDGARPNLAARLFHLDLVRRLENGDELAICTDRLEIIKKGQVIDAWKLGPVPRMMFLDWSSRKTPK